MGKTRNRTTHPWPIRGLILIFTQQMRNITLGRQHQWLEARSSANNRFGSRKSRHGADGENIQASDRRGVFSEWHCICYRKKQIMFCSSHVCLIYFCPGSKHSVQPNGGTSDYQIYCWRLRNLLCRCNVIFRICWVKSNKNQTNVTHWPQGSSLWSGFHILVNKCMECVCKAMVVDCYLANNSFS